MLVDARLTCLIARTLVLGRTIIDEGGASYFQRDLSGCRQEDQASQAWLRSSPNSTRCGFFVTDPVAPKRHGQRHCSRYQRQSRYPAAPASLQSQLVPCRSTPIPIPICYGHWRTINMSSHQLTLIRPTCDMGEPCCMGYKTG